MAPTSSKGDLLFTIQPEQYQAQLQQAKADVQAQQAALDHAETEFKRYSRLFEQKAAAATDVDNWRFQRDSAKAALMNAQAQVDLAKLNLSYTRVTAPFNGRMGRRLVDPGNLVGAGGEETTLAEINQIDPIYVYFTINERDLLRVRKLQQESGAGDYRSRPVPAYAGLANEQGYPHEGRIDFAAISVDPTTGTLLLRAVFPNPDRKILPGLFVRIRVPVGREAERHSGSGGGARLRSARPLRAGRQRQERRRTPQRHDGPGRKRHARHRQRPEGRRAGDRQRPAAGDSGPRGDPGDPAGRDARAALGQATAGG